MEQPSLPHPNKIKMADDNRVGEKEREEMEEVEAEAIPEVELKERKTSWGRLRRVDSLSLEAGHVSMPRGHTSKTNWARTLSLAFQSMGVVYGDIGTSPLYVYAGTFSHREVKGKDDIIGVLSLIIYTLILVPLVKYVLIVLWANDNGDGGTFALYSLICRYARVGLIPNEQPEDIHLSNYRLDVPSHQSKIAQKIKGKLETSKAIQIILFIVTILGTSMVIGDGVLTPCISVLSAVSGISSSLGQDVVVGVSIAILIALFSIQRFGTDKVGLCFAPVISVWFMFLTGIGVYNLFKYDPSVLRAFNPKYILDYFKRNGKDAWISLGGVVLCITGAEAMFADLGHFSVKAIQISFSCTVFPSILAAYAGQAAYLMKHPENVSTAFYSSIPDPLYWPTFVVAVAAAVIASQAMISGAFAIVSQSLSLGCFPRVKVVHTSAKYEGQVYIPEINYLLMISCILVCWIFKTTENIGNAYGIAVVAVMVITTGMITLIMLVIWKTRMMWIVIFTVVYGAVEGTYLTAVLYKFKEGGFLPLAFSLVLMIIMGIWHYVQRERYIYELKNKVSSEFIKELAANSTINRVPGIGLLYSELVQGIPPIFPHFIANIPSVHSVLVFVSIKNIPISKVLPEERFLFRQVEPRDYKMFRCVVRYGYKDVIEEPREFERQLVENLKEFLRHEHFILDGSALDPAIEVHSANQSTQLVMDDKVKVSSSSRRIHVEESMPQPNPEQIPSASKSSGSIRLASSGRRISVQLQNGAEEEMQFVQKAMDRGVVYLIGETEVIAEPKSSLFKKMIVNIAYSFLRKNFRQGDKMLAIPKTRLLRVGMTYEI